MVGPQDGEPLEEATGHPGAHAAGLDGVRIARLIDDTEAGSYGEIYSILISKDGTLAVEEYFREIDAETVRPIYSVTKSVASALVGIALHNQDLPSLEAKLPDFYPTYTVPTWASEITVHHLLTMQAGFEWDEWTTPYGSATNSASQISRSGDVVQYMLDLPMASDPGTRFTYSSGVSMLLSGVISFSTGATAREFAEAEVFEHLGLGSPDWGESMPGMTNTGWGLNLTSRQLLAFGEMFENDGRVGEVQVVPRSWVDLSTSHHTTTNNGLAYGFQWWRFRDGDPDIAALAVNDVYFAWGYGGQFVFVVPHADVVIVMTAANFDDSSPAFDMLRREVFPALR